MNATGREKRLSVVAALLDELDGSPHPPESGAWAGYHERVYSKHLSAPEADKMVASLCARVQALPDVSKYSLELQIWWRDHQSADKKRLEREMAEAEKANAKAAAIAKLTPYERKLLGLE